MAGSLGSSSSADVRDVVVPVTIRIEQGLSEQRFGTPVAGEIEIALEDSWALLLAKRGETPFVLGRHRDASSVSSRSVFGYLGGLDVITEAG